MIRLAVRAVALIGLLNAAAAQAASLPTRFDLICHGAVTDRVPQAKVCHLGPGGTGVVCPEAKPQTSFAATIHVDRTMHLFCLDGCERLYHLKTASPSAIAYAYDVKVADQDHAANRYREENNGDVVTLSTGGPFDFTDRWSFEAATGRFERTYVFDEGDRVSVSHNQQFMGRCGVAPFTGFARRKP